MTADPDRDPAPAAPRADAAAAQKLEDAAQKVANAAEKTAQAEVERAQQVEAEIERVLAAATPESPEPEVTLPRRRLHTGPWIVVIGVLLVAQALTLASSVVVPFVLAVLISLTLAPAMRALTRFRVPRGVAAALLVAGGLTLTWGVVDLLAEPAQAWMERAPQALRRLEQQVRDMRAPLEAANEATERLMNMAQDPGEKPVQTVVTETPRPLMGVLEEAPALLASLLATVFLVFLFLLYGDAIFRKFVVLMPGLAAKKEFVSGTREAQVELSRYLVTVTAINVMLGAATAGALYALGVPDPILWGGIAAILNFAPYLGAVVTLAILVVVGFAEFSEPWKALAVPGAFAILNILESQLITPLLVGRRLALDPVVIFVSLMVLGWMWGLAGMLLAVPLLSCCKIFAQRVPGGEKYAQLLNQ